MSDKQELQKAITEFDKARKEAAERISKAADKVRRTRQEQKE